MILIISENTDLSTCKVIDWLVYFQIDWKRINEGDILNLAISFDANRKSDVCLKTKKGDVSLSMVSKVWYRRGNLHYAIDQAFFPKNNEIRNHINYEWDTIRNYINSLFNELPSIGNTAIADDLNKIKLLEYAANSGLKIPDTIITGCKQELIRFRQKHKRVVSKGIQRNPSFKSGENNYGTHTKEVTNQIIEKTSETFFPSIFQEYIDKPFELRVFYLCGNCYAMAKFPNTYKTRIDIRNTEKKNYVRAVPFNLPKHIVECLKKLMNSINLNTGSIDLIVNPDNEFVFLEVNAIGQYDDVSMRCNYSLDKKIAEALIPLV